MAAKVFVAMSGGVDSSVAAYLLIAEGYDVAGVTMDVLESPRCGIAESAREVAEKLKIEHYTFDFKDKFKSLVIEPFINEYLSGRTPNPCVMCNRNIKWGALLEKALEMGCDYFATGHYANICAINGRFSLKRMEHAKDQTYAIYGLSQKQLEKTLFPLGKYTKNEIRQIASTAGLDVCDKPESQEICFVENNDYSDFIRKHTGKAEASGEFVLKDGTVLGTHKGISNYTIGQRKGLGISYSEPLFVQKLDIVKNKVVLGSDAELFSRDFTVKDVNYLSVSGITGQMECNAKIRYAHGGAKCVITPFEGFPDRFSCRFDEPQRAVTPGQSAVFYDENGVVIAGGIIYK